MFESAQLIDTFNINFCESGEDPKKLSLLRAQKQLSMKELSEATGHSRSYLRQQLRKFGIAQEKKFSGLQAYGWEWKDGVIVENANEQNIICEMTTLRKSGLGFKAIAHELNRRNIPAKSGGSWWGSCVMRVLKRVEKESP